ncbi:MAG: hypothetical protein RIK87_30455 [Fuerstiella sp.]
MNNQDFRPDWLADDPKRSDNKHGASTQRITQRQGRQLAPEPKGNGRYLCLWLNFFCVVSRHTLAHLEADKVSEQISETSDPGGRRNEKASPASKSVSTGPVRAEVLQQIIQATAGEASLSDDSRHLRDELRRVAARLQGATFGLDPVVIALVEPITGRFRRLTESQRTAITRAVARTLYDDANSRRVLERLWQSLSESRLT